MARSLKKGPFVDDHLLKKIDELNRKPEGRTRRRKPSDQLIVRRRRKGRGR